MSSLKFLVDNQLPIALARFLTSCGEECEHVLDVDLVEASDSQIWKYAHKNDYVIISKDEDFFNRANAASDKGRLIWIRLGNCRNATLLTSVERLWPKILDRLQAGERIIEIRSGK